MHRTGARLAADRIGMGMSRATVDTINNSLFMQTIGAKIMSGEGSTDVEHFEPFGSTAVVMGKTTDEQAQAGMMKGAAELILGSLMGNRSHPIAFPAADRRFRLNGLKPGESGSYDAFKQYLHFGKDAATLESPKSFVQRVASDRQQSGSSSDGSGTAGSSSSGGGQKKKNNGADVTAEKDVQVSVTAKKDGTYAVVANDAATITAKTITLKAGDCTLTISKDGFAFAGGKMTHDGKNVGKDHRHGQTMPGTGTTGEPEV